MNKLGSAIWVGFFLCAGVVGCIIGPNDGGGDGGKGGAGGQGGAAEDEHVCDGKSSCDACRACALEMACAAQFNACQNNASCVAIDQCVVICGTDADCKEQCLVGNPEGVNAYAAASKCLYCDECPKDCAGLRSCS